MDGAYDFEFDCLVDPVSTEAMVALYEDPGDTMGSYGIGPILASPRLAARDLQRLGGLVGGKRPVPAWPEVPEDAAEREASLASGAVPWSGTLPSTALQGPEREEAKTEDAGPKRSAKRARGNGGKCPHNRQRSRCKDCGGMGICEHNRQKSKCRECGGASICPHQRVRSRCKDCGGSSICPHQRLKSRCQHCGGSSLCQHGRRKEECKECGGSRICEHKRIRGQCRECNERRVCIHGQPKNRCAECLNQPSKVPFLKTSPATVATAAPGWELMSSEGREGAAGVPPRPTRTATDDEPVLATWTQQESMPTSSLETPASDPPVYPLLMPSSPKIKPRCPQPAQERPIRTRHPGGHLCFSLGCTCWTEAMQNSRQSWWPF